MTSDTDNSRDESIDDQYDVAVIGAGPAGCAAAVFTARAELKTLCLEDGRSSLLKSAHLENYLGFPAGIQPTQFLELAREHVHETGADYRREELLAVRRDDGSPFVLETDDRRYRADRVIATSWARTDFLEPLPVTREPEEPGPVMVLPTDETGRTDCDGLYAAGRITGRPHQALVSAGEGARVALTLIDDVMEYYNDWVVPEGYYDAYDREVPPGVEEISIVERRRRKRRGVDRMATFFESERDDDR